MLDADFGTRDSVIHMPHSAIKKSASWVPCTDEADKIFLSADRGAASPVLRCSSAPPIRDGPGT